MEQDPTQQSQSPQQPPNEWVARGKKLVDSLSAHTPEIADIAGGIVGFVVKTVVKTAVTVKVRAVKAYEEGVEEGKKA